MTVWIQQIGERGLEVVAIAEIAGKLPQLQVFRIEYQSLAEKARERRLRALMASNRNQSNIFI